MPHDTGPNKDAIAVLEHVVGVDPGTLKPARASCAWREVVLMVEELVEELMT